MRYKHWVDSTTEVENVVVLSSSSLFLASVDEVHVDGIRKKWATNANLIEIFGTDGILIIPLSTIQSVIILSTGNDGRSPLQYALEDSENLNVIRALLEKGASVSFSIDEMPWLNGHAIPKMRT